MEELIKNRKIKQFKKDDLIFEEGALCDTIGIILTGEVKIYTLTSNEEEFVIDTLKAGDYIGAALIFSSSPYFLGSCVASKTTDLCIISKNELLKIFKENSSILLEFLKIVSDKRLHVQERIKVLSQKSIREKILFLIFEKKDKNNIYHFNTKEELSTYLNIPRPSLSRELILLKDEGIIEYGRHYIKLIENKRG